MIRTFDCVIVHTADDATIHMNNEAYCYRELRNAFKHGAKCTIEIKSRRKPRSLAQNAYMHMAFQMMADDTGNDLEQIKTTMKVMYAKKPLLDKHGEQIYNKETGEQAFYIQDTRDMNTLEMTEFMDKVRLFSQEFLNITIPLPEQNIKLNLK